MIRPNARFTHVMLIALALAAFPSSATAQPARACCTITAIDTRGGVVSARETASGRVFEFKARNAALLGSLRVGQAVQANFATNQVSLDGRTVCCTVTKPPASSVVIRPNPPAPVRTAPGGRVGRTYELPKVTYGETQQITHSRWNDRLTTTHETRTVNARVGQRTLGATILHVNGRDGIRGAPIPDGPKWLMERHFRKLGLGESKYYFVHPQLAAQWAATHQVPDNFEPKKDDDSDECKLSITGVMNCSPQEVADNAVAEFERNRKKAQDWWDEVGEKLGEAAECFEDKTLKGPKVPVKFSKTPSHTVSLGEAGRLSGSMTLGLPIEADFEADVDFSYVPCLPFMFRPKRIGADGSMSVGQKVSVDLSTDAAFSKTIPVPPAGGAQIVLYVIPIIIGDIPVAVIDVSLYIAGEIVLKGEAKATASFSMSDAHVSAFKFDCDGGGCDGERKSIPVPTTTTESMKVEGELSVQPAIYTALQLSFDYNVLQARAGPMPFLLGLANGCAGGSVTQASGNSSISVSSGLTADMDWGVKVRAEAFAAGQRLGKKWEKELKSDHIWYKDLLPGGSSSLIATVAGPAQAVAGQATLVRVRMPDCYPYSDGVEYRVTWTGGATVAAAPLPGVSCQNLARCKAKPTKDILLSITWPNAGAQTLSVQLVRDEHGRRYSPLPAPGQLNVDVRAAGGGAP